MSGDARLKTANGAVVSHMASLFIVGTVSFRSLRCNITCCYSVRYSQPLNQECVRSLGVNPIFDLHSSGVIAAIVSAVVANGLVIRHLCLVIVDVALYQNVLQRFTKESGGDEKEKGVIASASPIPANVVTKASIVIMLI